jgi:hypothetical protein
LVCNQEIQMNARRSIIALLAAALLGALLASCSLPVTPKGDPTTTTTAAKPCYVTSPVASSSELDGATVSRVLTVSVIGPFGGPCTPLAGRHAVATAKLTHNGTSVGTITLNALPSPFVGTAPYSLTATGVDKLDISVTVALSGKTIFTQSWSDTCVARYWTTGADCYRPSITAPLTVPSA